MKKIKMISLMVALILVLTVVPISASAANTNYTMDDISSKQIFAKKTFAQEMDTKLALQMENGNIKEFDEDKINTLREQYSFATTDIEKKHYSDELGKYGVYVFNEYIAEESNGFSDVILVANEVAPSATPNAMIGSFPSSDSSDVTLNTPTVFYDSIVKEWTVTCGGEWKNNNCKPTAYIGTYVGDADAFGVGYTNIQYSYNTYVKSAYAYIADENGNNRVTTSNRSDGDGSQGFGFRLQDKMLNGLYIGYRWYGSCTYDLYFSYYCCIITGYYIHTYSSAEIGSISFGIQDKTAGVEATIENTSKSFSAYSSDLKWGNW